MNIYTVLLELCKYIFLTINYVTILGGFIMTQYTDLRWGRLLNDEEYQCKTQPTERIQANACIAQYIGSILNQKLNDCIHKGYSVFYPEFQQTIYVPVIYREKFFTFLDDLLGSEESKIFCTYHGFYDGETKSIDFLAAEFGLSVDNIECTLKFLENQLAHSHLTPLLPLFIR